MLSFLVNQIMMYDQLEIVFWVEHVLQFYLTVLSLLGNKQIVHGNPIICSSKTILL